MLVVCSELWRGRQKNR